MSVGPGGIDEQEFRRFMLGYKFGLDEVMTKVNILREELVAAPEECPIEHVSARLKTPESLFAKADRLGVEHTLEAYAREVPDLAGVRVVCSFLSDVAVVREMICRQQDIHLVEENDYIARPKPNGYRSLHLIVDTPVHLSDGTRWTRVEIQLRTVAMDFWASLEHKIRYKYDGRVPDALSGELDDAAVITRRMDEKMQALHRQVRGD